MKRVFGINHLRLSIFLFLIIIFISTIFVQPLLGFTNSSKNDLTTKNEPIRVLFDESKGPWGYVGEAPEIHAELGWGYEFVDLGELLLINDFTVDTLQSSEELDESNIVDYDILVICLHQYYYTINEIEIIYSWVKDGGSLLLISDFYSSSVITLPIVAIAERFGYEFGDSEIFDWDTYNYDYWNLVHDGDCIKSHEITDNITRIETYGTYGIINSPEESQVIISTDNDGTAYWNTPPNYPANNIPVLSVCENWDDLEGQIAILDDIHIFRSDYDSDWDGIANIFDSDNEILALNLFSWLGKKPIEIISNKSVYFSFIAVFGILIYLVRRKSSKN
jgi:hypothetical protein